MTPKQIAEMMTCGCVEGVDAAVADRLSVALTLAASAGDLIMSHFKHARCDAESKADGSPVTIADRAAETCIRDGIRSAFSNDALRGEEHADEPGTSDFTWVIDPIDGTAGFVRGTSRERDDARLHPATHRAGVMQMGSCRGAAGEDETFERLQVFVHAVDPLLQSRDLRYCDAQRRPFGGRLGFRDAQIGPHVEQVVLNPPQSFGKRLRHFDRERDAEQRIQLIDTTVSGNPRMGLRHAAAIAQRRLATIAAFGVDSIQIDHQLAAAYRI